MWLALLPAVVGTWRYTDDDEFVIIDGWVMKRSDLSASAQPRS
jgi:hypothetical protein